MTLEQLVTYAIVLGVALGAFVSILIVGVLAFGPITRRLVSRVSGLLPEQIRGEGEVGKAIKEQAQQSAEDYFAERGKKAIDDLEVTVKRLREEADDRKERVEKLEAESARRAADDQQHINELETRVRKLETEVGILQAERDRIAEERDSAVRKVDEQARDIKRMKEEQVADRRSIHDLEIKVAEMRGRDNLMQELLNALRPAQIDPDILAPTPATDPAAAANGAPPADDAGGKGTP